MCIRDRLRLALHLLTLEAAASQKKKRVDISNWAYGECTDDKHFSCVHIIPLNLSNLAEMSK